MIRPGHKQLRFGGLGFRRAVQLAPSTFLASAAASSYLISNILPAYLQSLPTPQLDVALSQWSQGHDNPPPSSNAACIQKSWDASIVSSTMESLLENAPDNLARAQLLAASTKESGAWLHDPPHFGLRMDDDTIRVVWASVWAPPFVVHTPANTGAEVDHLATHGLSCRKVRGTTIAM